jgi:hypothetical protein
LVPRTNVFRQFGFITFWCEGLVQFGTAGKPHALTEAAHCFELLYPFIDDARSDVIAQAMRLGYTLRSLGFLQARGWSDRLDDLRHRQNHSSTIPAPFHSVR